jgi:hypothetical protein
MKTLEPEVVELLDRYAKGAVTQAETAQIKALLQSRPECREYHDFLLHLDGALQKDAVDPPLTLKPKIMAELLRPKSFRGGRWAATFLTAVLVVALGLALTGNWDKVSTAMSQMISGGLAAFHLK